MSSSFVGMTQAATRLAPVEMRDLLGVSRNLSLGGIRFEAVGCEIDLDDLLQVTFNVGEETVVAVGKHGEWYEAAFLDKLERVFGQAFPQRFDIGGSGLGSNDDLRFTPIVHTKHRCRRHSPFARPRLGADC